MPTEAPLLEVRNLTISFVNDEKIKTTAVQDVSFSVNRGEILCIVGESGCGKSVSAMSIPRLLPSPPSVIDRGEIIFDGINLLDIPVSEMRTYRGKRIGVIFQNPMTALSPLVKVGDQIIETLQIHFPISRKAAYAKTLEWLEKVGIPQPELRMKSYPYELSGGMQQRVMIAMCLILEPDLIIADEPTTALDVTIQAQVLELMLNLHRKNSAMIFITHDMGVVYKMANRVAVMYAGQVVEKANSKDFFKHPQHPYSQALLKALPSAATRGKKLMSIPGQVPAPGNYPIGCRFAERCTTCQKECRSAMPELVAQCNQHETRCFQIN